MMNKLYFVMLGDTVAFKDFEGKREYYLVFNIELDDGGSYARIDSIQLFPFTEELVEVDILEKAREESEKDVVIVFNAYDEDGANIINSLNERRSQNGYVELPPIDDLRNMKQRRRIRTKQKEEKVLKQKQDIIAYEDIFNVDECLDAMNSLSELHKAFGDEEYLEQKEKVKERLASLLESNLFRG